MTPDITRAKSIHLVLDTAVPIVAAYPEVVAVWAEPVLMPHDPAPHWEGRYEVADGRSVYLFGDSVAEVSLRRATGATASYPGAIRFEAREVADWPAMKAEMAAQLRRHTDEEIAWWFGTKNEAWSGRLERLQRYPDAYGKEEAITRGLFLTREMLDGAPVATTSTPWRKIDENETHSHWQCTNDKGDTCDTWQSLGSPLSAVDPDKAVSIRIKLGRRGFELQPRADATRGYSGDYEPRDEAHGDSRPDRYVEARVVNDIYGLPLKERLGYIETMAGNGQLNPERANGLRREFEVEVAQNQQALDRERKIAALGVALRQKVEPRYPSEARSERSYEKHNPRFR